MEAATHILNLSTSHMVVTDPIAAWYRFSRGFSRADAVYLAMLGAVFMGGAMVLDPVTSAAWQGNNAGVSWGVVGGCGGGGSTRGRSRLLRSLSGPLNRLCHAVKVVMHKLEMDSPSSMVFPLQHTELLRPLHFSACHALSTLRGCLGM